MGFLFGDDDAELLPPPDEDEASKIALEEKRKIAMSQERFLQRQGTLGPIQLQAPVLRI